MSPLIPGPPVAPVSPLSPAAPVSPFAPVAPVAPGIPAGPTAPRGIVNRRIAAELVPVFATAASEPGNPVVVAPTLTVAAVPPVVLARTVNGKVVDEPPAVSLRT